MHQFYIVIQRTEREQTVVQPVPTASQSHAQQMACSPLVNYMHTRIGSAGHFGHDRIKSTPAGMAHVGGYVGLCSGCCRPGGALFNAHQRRQQTDYSGHHKPLLSQRGLRPPQALPQCSDSKVPGPLSQNTQLSLNCDSTM